MKLYRFLSTLLFKTTFVILIIGALTLSSTLESMSLLTKNSFEIENIDWQEDSSEEKENESDKKPSKILNKEVYVKETKGLKMVKKFFIWETNSNSTDYPKYVYYGIDYSPSRASKLNREIKVSDDKKQIEKIFQDEIESNVKKGWNKF